MPRDWFKLSLKDGSAERSKAPADAKPVAWTECDLENILALNPKILDVDSLRPLRLGGLRATVGSPDQAYMDELGRLTVVEVKKVRVSLPVIAQALGYAEHWRLLPPGEVDRCLGGFADPDTCHEIYGQALSELRAWAEEDGSQRDQAKIKGLGKLVLARLASEWVHHPATSIDALAHNLWNADRLPFVGAPARLLAVAPSFREDCLGLAKALTTRMVGIELIEVEIVRSGNGIYVGREWVHRDPVIEPTWQLFRRVWSIESIRQHFVLNGWADRLSRDAFSLSARVAPDARFWICASGTEASVTTVVPDGWFASDRDARKKLRQRLLDELPPGFDRNERWLLWKSETPRQLAGINKCIVAVANAVCTVLAPAGVSARQ